MFDPNTVFNSKLPQTLLQACPAYRASPVVQIDIHDSSVLVKDETNRMGLGAFKALGGVYAVACLLAEKAGLVATPQTIDSDEFRDAAKTCTFVCASAGNHGMAVAAGAQIFGAKSRIHLSQTVPPEFAQRLLTKGAEVIWSGATYEESVACAVTDAEVSGARHLADGAWPGYIEPPRLVMEGYTVIASEMADVFANTGNWPSHVYLQAGVGGLAAALAVSIRKDWPVQPKLIIVEPLAAQCLATSAKAEECTTVEGPVSNMGRLDCKAPSLIAFELLRQLDVSYSCVNDTEAEAASEDLRSSGIATTPSGAAGLAALKKANHSSSDRPLILVTEGPA